MSRSSPTLLRFEAATSRSVPDTLLPLVQQIALGMWRVLCRAACYVDKSRCSSWWKWNIGRSMLGAYLQQQRIGFKHIQSLCWGTIASCQ